jgi:hypothetical protein
VDLSSVYALGRAAARWFQSVERRLHDVGWTDFYVRVHDRFRRDQHDALIRQLFHIRQTA